MINKKHRKHTSRSSQPYSSQSQEFPEALSNTQVNAKLRKIESLKTSNRFFSPGKQQLEFFKANTKPLEIEITEDKMDMMIKNLEHLKNELKKTGYSEQLSFQYGNENDEKERITSRIDFDSPAERSVSQLLFLAPKKKKNSFDFLKEKLFFFNIFYIFSLFHHTHQFNSFLTLYSFFFLFLLVTILKQRMEAKH